jgi:hypothetical protein
MIFGDFAIFGGKNWLLKQVFNPTRKINPLPKLDLLSVFQGAYLSSVFVERNSTQGCAFYPLPKTRIYCISIEYKHLSGVVVSRIIFWIRTCDFELASRLR